MNNVNYASYTVHLYCYVQEYLLNGKKLSQPRISFADVVKGGKLKIKLGPNPVDEY